MKKSSAFLLISFEQLGNKLHSRDKTPVRMAFVVAQFTNHKDR